MHVNKNGFTLLELLVAVIIVGILVLAAVPSMRAPIERSRARNAEFNLLAIYSAQKRHLLSEKTYFVCDQIADPDDRVAAINKNLSIKIDDPYFEYQINSTDAQNTYRAWATRKDGRCRNMSLNVTAANSTVLKDRRCTVW